MVGLNNNNPTRDQVLKFMEEKQRIEQEIYELSLVLETNNVGMRDPLVDQDGYPRNDVDVYRVRHARNRIICLQNDHNELMKQIERGLHTLHSDYMNPSGAGTSASRNNVQPMDTSSHNGHAHMNGHAHTNGHASNGHMLNGHSDDPRVALVVEGTRDLSVVDRAFVKVNFVSAGSPADSAGIRVDDEVLEFGSVNANNFRNLSQIGEIVQHSVGSRIDLKIRRGGVTLNVNLVPNPWSGRGLLGCNIVPV